MFFDDGLTKHEIAEVYKWDWQAEEQVRLGSKETSGSMIRCCMLDLLHMHEEEQFPNCSTPNGCSKVSTSNNVARTSSRTSLSTTRSPSLSRMSLGSSYCSSLCPIREVERWATVASRLGIDHISKLEVRIVGNKQQVRGVTKYAVQISGPDGSYIVYRRYTEFEELYREMFGQEAATLGEQDVTMPPKSLFKKIWSREFQEERERGLEKVALAACRATADADLGDCCRGLQRFLGWEEGQALQWLWVAPVAAPETPSAAADMLTASGINVREGGLFVQKEEQVEPGRLLTSPRPRSFASEGPLCRQQRLEASKYRSSPAAFAMPQFPRMSFEDNLLCSRSQSSNRSLSDRGSFATSTHGCAKEVRANRDLDEDCLIRCLMCVFQAIDNTDDTQGGRLEKPGGAGQMRSNQLTDPIGQAQNFNTVASKKTAVAKRRVQSGPPAKCRQ